MLRKLGIFEKAILIGNQHAPFNIVSVVQMKNAPSPETLLDGVNMLRSRHPLLRAQVTKEGSRIYFEERKSSNFHFEVQEKTSEDQWQKFAEREMDHSFNLDEEALFRVTYLYTQGSGDLVLTLHHGITDAVGGMNLFNELLQICAGEKENLAPLEVIPPPEERFPAQYQGIRRFFSVGRYAVLEMSEMFSYLFRARNKRQPPVRLGGSGKIITLQLPEELVDQLSRAGRKRGITLNSLLNAAQVLAVNRHLYHGAALPMRTFAFANLRPYTIPPTPNWDLGSFVAMLVYTLDVHKDEDIWDLAKKLQHKIYRTLKSGDKFNALLMSENLLRFFTSSKSMRFATTALNYSNLVPLKSNYGEIEVLSLHGFVSGYDLGPELASQARLFKDKIWWDFIYLNTDMNEQTASSIIEEITQILEQAVRQEH